jgi:L-histidine N-alpha-methyltransferase
LPNSPAEPHFESDEHRRLFLNFVRRGSLPLKFAYAGSAAYTHDKLARSAGYQAVVGEVPNEVSLLARSFGSSDSLLQIAEIGPGNGQHSAALLSALNNCPIGPLKQYLALDFSRELLDIAATAISPIRLESLQTEVWDIETEPTDAIRVWRLPGPTVILQLGSTIGNFQQPVLALRNLRSSVQRGDFLLLGVALMPKSLDPDAILAPYRTKVFEAAALEPLRAARMEMDACEFKVFLKGNTIRAEVELHQDARVDDIALPAGTTIECFRSHRFSHAEIDSISQDGGWQPIDRYVNDDSTHQILLAVAQ